MAAKKKTSAKETSQSGDLEFRERIIDAALAHAAEVGWNQSALGPLAAYMDVPVNDIRKHFPDANAIADAWFERALTAMLASPPAGFAELPVKQRFEILMLRWFDALAPYRTVTAEMLAAKLHLPHVHHWGPAIAHLSQTLQLMRDAVGLRAGGRRQQIEEIGLTAIFLTTFRVWCRDTSDGQEKTRRFLSRRLGRADRAILRLYAVTGL